MVLIFNMVPAFPLDGGRVLRSILWGATGNVRQATRWASAVGQAFAWVLIGLGMLQFFQPQLGGRHLDRADRHVPRTPRPGAATSRCSSARRSRASRCAVS